MAIELAVVYQPPASPLPLRVAIVWHKRRRKRNLLPRTRVAIYPIAHRNKTLAQELTKNLGCVTLVGRGASHSLQAALESTMAANVCADPALASPR